MLTQAEFDRENHDVAKRLLGLSENELYTYWIEHVACDYHHGLYLNHASERSKKWCFNRWKSGLQAYAGA